MNKFKINKLKSIFFLLTIILVSNLKTVADEVKSETENINFAEIAELYNKFSKKVYTAESIKPLKHLVLSKSNVTDKELETLSHLPNVLILNLGATGRLTPACLPSLARMESVRIVDLVNHKIFKDVDTLIETFKNYKNLEILSTMGLDEIMKTEKYQEFLKSHPGILVINGPYKTTRPEHKSSIKKTIEGWVEKGIISKEEYF